MNLIDKNDADEEYLSRRKITDNLAEMYNDVLIWHDDDDWDRGIKEGIYMSMSRINSLTADIKGGYSEARNDSA